MSSDELHSIRDYYDAIKNSPLDNRTKAAFEEKFVDQYEGIKTKSGYEFITCIKPMLDAKDDLNPRIYEESCLEEFEEFFLKVLECNGSTKKQHVQTDLDELNMDIYKQYSDFTSMIVSVDFEVRRNFSGCVMGENKLSQNTKSLGQSIIGGVIGLKMNGEYLSTLDRERIRNLRRNGLFLGDDQRTVNEIDKSIKFPALERGVYFGTENMPSVGTQLIVYVNMNDHLRVLSRDNTFQELNRAYDTVKKSVEKIIYNMNFPYETWDYVMQAVPKMSTTALAKLFGILDEHHKSELEARRKRREEREQRKLKKQQMELEAAEAAAAAAAAREAEKKEEEKKEGAADSEPNFLESTEKRPSIGSNDEIAFPDTCTSTHNVSPLRPFFGNVKRKSSKKVKKFEGNFSKQFNVSSSKGDPVDIVEEQNVEGSADKINKDIENPENHPEEEEEEIYEDDSSTSDTITIIKERFKFAHTRRFGYACHNPSDLGGGLCVRFLVRIPFIGSLPNADVVLKDLTTLPFVILARQCEEEDTLAYFICRRSHGMRGSKFIESAFNDLLVVLRMEKEMKAFNRLYFEKDIMAVEPIDFLVHVIQKRQATAAASHTTKYLSALLAKKYSTAMTPYGGTLSHCIRANVYHPETMFPRACDPYAYSLFSDFLHPILMEYNAIEKPQHRVADLDPMADFNFTFKNERVHGFRARIARNVTGYGFPPTVSDVDRKLIEHKLKYCLSQLKDDLIGRYYCLSELKGTPLGDKNYFIGEDNIAANVGLYRNWPESRGVFDFFKEPNNTQCVASVNGEDHLRIMSLDRTGRAPGSTLRTVVRILHYLNKVLPDLFVKDKELGYLTFCPSEAGTGLRLSAQVTLKKKLKDDKELLRKHCLDLKLQIRGSNGEHTPIENDLYDVSYKARMGYTEKEMMTNFLEALKALVEADS